MENTWFGESLSVLPFILIKLQFYPITLQLKSKYILLGIRSTQNIHKQINPKPPWKLHCLVKKSNFYDLRLQRNDSGQFTPISGQLQPGHVPKFLHGPSDFESRHFDELFGTMNRTLLWTKVTWQFPQLTTNYYIMRFSAFLIKPIWLHMSIMTNLWSYYSINAHSTITSLEIWRETGEGECSRV